MKQARKTGSAAPPTPSGKAARGGDGEGSLLTAPLALFDGPEHPENATGGMASVLKWSILGLICVISFAIRLFAVARWESVIHEFVSGRTTGLLAWARVGRALGAARARLVWGTLRARSRTLCELPASSPQYSMVGRRGCGSTIVSRAGRRRSTASHSSVPPASLPVKIRPLPPGPTCPPTIACRTRTSTSAPPSTCPRRVSTPS
jgi:hypothetical protein